MAHPNSSESCRVLLVYPRFSAATFWNFTVACELVGARYPAAPLGLITLAATVAAALGHQAGQPQHRGTAPRQTSIGPTW